MIAGASDGRASRSLSRRLMVTGLSVWCVAVGGALAPRALHAVLYPSAGESPFERAAAQPPGAAAMWAGLAVWSVTWTFVLGHLLAAWAARRGRPSWATPLLLLSSLASPLVFGLAARVLLPLATHEAYRDGGVLPFLSAVVLQLLISKTYAVATAPRPREEPPYAARA